MSPPWPPSPPDGPPRHVFLAAERHAAVAALPALNFDFRFVSKHGRYRALMGKAYALLRKHTALARGNTKETRRFTLASWSGKKSVRSGCSGLLFKCSSCFFRREDADETATPATVFEANHTVDQREQRIVLRAPDVLSRLVARAAL